MAKKNPLSEGIVGRELIKYFDELSDQTELGFGLDRMVPVDAVSLNVPPRENPNKEQVQYRITFEDGSVSDWLVTFESGPSVNIVSAEQFNEVL